MCGSSSLNANIAMHLTVRPVTRLALQAPPLCRPQCSALVLPCGVAQRRRQTERVDG